MNIRELTEKEFTENLAFIYTGSAGRRQMWSRQRCIVVFYASGYGPSRMVKSHLKELIGEQRVALPVYKVDIEKESRLAAACTIGAIPTIWFCAPCREPVVIEGVLTKAGLRIALSHALEKSGMNTIRV